MSRFGLKDANAFWPDMAPLDVFRDRVCAHEALHKFFGFHGIEELPEADEGIMNALTAATASTVRLTNRQILRLQQTLAPQ